MLSRGDDVVPIPGTKKRSRLDENLGATQVDLTAADLSELDAKLPPGAAAGTRYAQAAMSSVNR